MRKIRSYSGFIKAINELDTTDTYLSNVNTNYAQSDYPKFRKIFGKVFKDAPTTSGVDYGIKYKCPDYQFDPNSDKGYSWYVTFPNDFYKYFVPKEENTEEWVKKNKDIVNELMSNLNQITISTEGGLNRTHFPDGIPNSLKGLGLGYIIYEGFIRHLGYASSKIDASYEARKVWSRIAKDPDFMGMISDNMILVFRKDFENKEEVLNAAFNYLDITIEGDDIESIESSLEENDIQIDPELLNLSKEKIEIIKQKNIKKELTRSAERTAWSIESKLFCDHSRFFGEELQSIRKKIKEIRSYMKDRSKEKLINILKSNDIELKEEQIESDLFIRKLDDTIRIKFESYIKSSLISTVREIFKSIKRLIPSEINTSSIEAASEKISEMYNSKFKEEIDFLEENINFDWFNNPEQSFVVVKLNDKYIVKFDIKEPYTCYLVYDKKIINTSDLILDMTQLFKFISVEIEFNNRMDSETFINSKKSELEKMNIQVSKSYKWAANTFNKLKIGQDIEAVIMSPIEHFEFVKKIKSTEKVMKMKNAYKYLAKELHKAFLQGGYEKVIGLYDTEIKGQLQHIDIEVFDDPNYGLTEERKPDVKLPAKEHIERRIKAYKEAKNMPTPNINNTPLKVQTQAQVQAQTQIEKPVEKKSFIKKFIDFFR
jgi:hypothetical protein